MNGKIFHVEGDGIMAKFTDVTEAVQALYDLATGGMDFGSGFWSYEDAAPVAALARTCGFGDHERVQRYADDRMHERERAAWQRDNGIDPRMMAPCVITPHDHAFSTAGRCMWPWCPRTEN